MYRNVEIDYKNELYLNRYFNMVDNLQRLNRGEPNTYKHHILPSSMFPEYSNLKEHPWNMCVVTAREHFLLHWILSKAVGGKMIYAFHLMCHKKDYSHLVTSKVYESMMNAYRTTLSERMKGGTPWNRGVPMTEEHKLNLMEYVKTRDYDGENNPNYMNFWSDEQKLRLSRVAKERWANPDFKIGVSGKNHHMYGRTGSDNPNFGRQCSNETKEKISNALKGIPLSAEQKEKISKSTRGKPKRKRGTCVHCGKEMDNGNLAKSHNDNCKHKRPAI